jgi:hypothetical protein
MVTNDLLLEPDLQIEDGDIKIGPSDDNNSLYIIYAQPGQLRVNGLLGVGIINFINSPDETGRDLAKALRLEHRRDGYKVTTLELDKIDQDGGQELSVKAVRIKK